jgi:hypothetical protein
MNARRAAAFALLLPLLAPCAARADDARSIEVARKSYVEGLEQYKRSDVEGARLSFAQSYAAWPAIETLKSLAIAEFDTGRFLDALKHFKTYAKDKNADPEFLKKVPSYIERCNQHVAHLRIVAPPGAAIVVDGRRVFDLREPLDVAAGTHSVTMREPAPAETRTVDVALAQTVDVAFTRDATAPATAMPSPTPVGADNASNTASSTSDGFWTTRNKWAVGLGAGAVVSAAVGTGYGLSAIGKHSSYKELAAQKDDTFCSRAPADPYCEALSTTSSAQRSAAHISTIAFSVSGALLVGAAVVWLWPKSHDDTRSGRTWIVPSVGQNGAGVLAGGNF